MKNRRMLPAAIAAGVAGFAVTLPAAHAEISPDKTVEQNAEYAESTIKDAWLDGKLETALLFNEHLNSFAIDTEVKNGVAYLSGSVESDIDRDLAGQIAESIEGVSTVKNNLAVDKSKAMAAKDSDTRPESSGFKADVLDATLTAEVKTELLVNSNTQGMSINVDTEDGVVTLSGQVASEQEKELAGQIAANRDGTQSVRNMLTVENEEEAE